MQVSANLGAGASDLNASYFRLYQENLNNILNWTRQHMGGRQGACVPETMRFNGRGYENEEWIPNAPINCGEDSPPYYNARTISTGAEVSVWVWAQYEYTDDMAFLKKNYPLMREAARFLLAYSTTGPDGKLHTFPSNATRCNGTFMTQPRTYPQCERCSPRNSSRNPIEDRFRVGYRIAGSAD